MRQTIGCNRLAEMPYRRLVPNEILEAHMSRLRDLQRVSLTGRKERALREMKCSEGQWLKARGGS